jgi:hypothetical protein
VSNFTEGHLRALLRDTQQQAGGGGGGGGGGGASAASAGAGAGAGAEGGGAGCDGADGADGADCADGADGGGGAGCQEGPAVVPHVNQVEVHPWLPQEALRRFCAEKGILVQAYAPLGSPGGDGSTALLDCAAVRAAAGAAVAAGRGRGAEGVTPAQVLLRWAVQQGLPALPKSAAAAHQLENSRVFDFELGEGAMQALEGGGGGQRAQRFCWDPTGIA